MNTVRIGSYQLENNVIVAPMAGITDRPFRQLCRRLGAGLAVSEMLSSNPKVWKTEKSMNRMDHSGESGIRAVQIAGADPELMAQAAQFNVANGAQIIDINMGCPAKKVNKKLAGSALLQFPELVEEIVDAVKGVAEDHSAGRLSLDEIDTEEISKRLYDAHIPDPDLVIRTSGEERVSNFLLWQIAYSELYFTDVHWPSFSKADLYEALESYQLRRRRYGE